MTDPNTRAPIAAVASGIDYQILVALTETLRAILLTERDVVEIGLEVRDAGWVDDIVIRHASGPPRMLQVKHAMLAGSALNTDYLTEVSGTSTMLRRLHQSFTELGRESDQLPLMEIFTDRPLDPNDPMMACRDQQTLLLVPEVLAKGPQSELGKKRAEWLEHLDCDIDELATMLQHLRVVTDRVSPLLDEDVRTIAAALGLATDDDAILRATEYVRNWIKDRDRDRRLDRLKSELSAEMGLADRRALVQIHAIARLPEDADAIAEVDWVDLFAGPDADAKRTMSTSSTWEDRVRPDLVEVRQALRDAGVDRAVVRFLARQAVTFLVGFYLRRASGFTISFAQHGSLWSSIDADAGATPISTDLLEADKSATDSAIVFGFSQDITNDVVRFVREAGLPIRDLLTIAAATGPSQSAIISPEHAAGISVSAIEAVRNHLRERPTEAVHLFFAGPGALAGLIGHRWNALPAATVYEHTGGSGYEATLQIES